MGRWYAALKEKTETAFDGTDRTDKTLHDRVSSVLSVSYLGKSEKTSADAIGVSSVLSVPLSGYCEISRSHSVDVQALVEERAAILECDAELLRADAERQAASKAGHSISPKSDAELYADALRQIEPCGYGPVAVFLGWGAGRASAAETELRRADRISYDRTGRGRIST